MPALRNVAPPYCQRKSGRRDVYEETTHSFVVKVWLEEAPRDTACPLWRGHITHVMSNRRRHVQSLEEIAAFIAGYLDRSGIGLSLRMRWEQWLNRRKR